MTSASKNSKSQSEALPLGVVVKRVGKAESIIFWTGFASVIITSIALLTVMAMEVFS